MSCRGWLALILAVAVLGGVWMLKVHSLLAPTRRVDTKILVVEGWVHEYVLRAAMVEFQNGHYEKLYTTGGPIIGSDGFTNDFNTAASVGAELLVKFGMPKDAVQLVPSHIAGRDRTYSSALALRDWFGKNNLAGKNFNVLTEDAHARRTQMLFQKAFVPEVTVGIIAVTNPDYEPQRWWRYSEGVREILGESIAWFYAAVFFHPAAPPGR